MEGNSGNEHEESRIIDLNNNNHAESKESNKMDKLTSLLFNRMEEMLINKNLKKDIVANCPFRQFNIIKVPEYKESLIFISSLIIVNAIIFNLIRLPIRVIVMFIMKLLNGLTREESKLLFYYSLKVILLLLSYYLFDVRHILSNIRLT